MGSPLLPRLVENRAVSAHKTIIRLQLRVPQRLFNRNWHIRRIENRGHWQRRPSDYSRRWAEYCENSVVHKAKEIISAVQTTFSNAEGNNLFAKAYNSSWTAWSAALSDFSKNSSSAKCIYVGIKSEFKMPLNKEAIFSDYSIRKRRYEKA